MYAIDLLGFGRSSRPDFPLDEAETEALFVDTLEAWRSALGLDTMVLLGHSFGGYQVGAYALCHPERVNHIIFADPW